jgi:Leucine-rich repeat (LRR) protein
MRLCFVKFISLLHALSADKSAPGCPHTDTIENWSDNGLESLPNWEAFDVKPTVLDMSGNVIKSLEADGLIDYACLRYVSFRNNAIRDVNPMAFNGLAVSLIHLDLAGNKINTIVNVTFSYIPKLETLLLSNNSVTNLDRTVFADLKVLHSLDLSLNYLSYILDGTFDWNEKLEFLSLSHNRIEIISKFTFKMLRNLKHLDLSDNNISFLHRNAFLSLRQLEWISLSNNKIKQLHKNDFGSLKQVKYFNLSTNELRDIKSRLFLNCTRLQNLSIAHNQIIELQQEALYGLFDLRYFDLSHNKLAHLSPDMFISNKSQLSSNRTLPPPNHHSDTVCTEYNSPNYSLTTFRLNNNSITSLDQCAFVPARGLQVIDLAANNLSALDYRVFCPLTKLSSLDIAFNKLTTIDYPGAEWIRDTETAINFTGTCH